MWFSYTIILTKENEFIAFGSLGSMKIISTINTFKWNYNEDIVDIKAGDNCNLILTSNGNVYSWGSNSHGSLGFGEQVKFISIPTLINNLSNIIQINTSYFLQSNFKIFNYYQIYILILIINRKW